MPMPRLLPVLPLVALGFHQASSSWRRQLLSMACNGETTVACNNGPSCIPWQGEPGVFSRRLQGHDRRRCSFCELGCVYTNALNPQ